ncbi:hypothetical protein FRC15_005258 [Serendipita sp. 397]|nr:hypothetical protein FRC15_005258 [Serendipita sp. 397]
MKEWRNQGANTIQESLCIRKVTESINADVTLKIGHVMASVLAAKEEHMVGTNVQNVIEQSDCAHGNLLYL